MADTENKGGIDVSRQQGKEVSQTSTGKTEETATGKTSTDKTEETGGANGGEHDNGNGAGQDDINPATGKPYTASEWKDKFSASARGAQQLLDEKKALLEAGELSKAENAKLTKEIEDLRVIAEGKNPEGLKLQDLQSSLAKTTNELALVKENGALDSFEKKEPLSASKREALRTLARANPSKSLQELWNDNLKSGAEADAKAEKEKKDSQGKGASDQGKETSTRESAGDTVKTPSGFDTGLSLEDFNKLSVAKRGELLKR